MKKKKEYLVNFQLSGSGALLAIRAMDRRDEGHSVPLGHRLPFCSLGQRAEHAVTNTQPHGRE